MLERTEMPVVSLRERRKLELRDGTDMEAVGGVLKRNILRWFGRVEGQR